jgi:23S rRNA (adenine2503-C2)-methyltransferase
MAEAGQPPYRARQLFHGMYRKRAASVAQVSTLPAALRAGLAGEGGGLLPRVEHLFVSADGTIRYLIAFADGESVETVWMPEGDGGEQGDGSEAGEDDAGEDGAAEAGAGASAGAAQGGRFRRATICVSSQVGCAVDCRFCLTALLGVKRNLTAGEIVGQVLVVLNQHGVDLERERINLVFMGMGEPFLNYANFIKAVRLLAEGTGIAPARMTVSTAGIVPRIAELGAEAVRPKLAISLNAPNDELRTRLMPLNKKWDLEALLGAARAFPLRPRERLTFEYVLLDGVNDQPEQARELAGLLGGLRAKVNLIALNPGPGIGFATPAEERVQEFQRILVAAGIPTFVRRPRGRDIYAACGQLKRTVA